MRLADVAEERVRLPVVVVVEEPVLDDRVHLAGVLPDARDSRGERLVRCLAVDDRVDVRRAAPPVALAPFRVVAAAALVEGADRARDGHIETGRRRGARTPLRERRGRCSAVLDLPVAVQAPGRPVNRRRSHEVLDANGRPALVLRQLESRGEACGELVRHDEGVAGRARRPERCEVICERRH